MIKEISISNFQSHKGSSLKFSPNVNIIVGSSDSGKTAVLRALRWVISNRPQGDAFRSNWGGKTSVELFTDNTHVVRSKDKEEVYILGDTHFKAFRTEVPQEIQKALNIEEINFQSQLDSPFLLTKSAGEVASYFNKIAHLEKIDLATTNINSAIRELTSNIKYSEGQEVSLKGNLETFAYLEKFEIDVEVLEETEKQFKQLCNSKDKLETVISSYQKNKKTITGYKEILELEKPLEQIFKWKDEIEDIGTEGSELQFVVKQIKEVQKEIAEQTALLSLETVVNNLLRWYKDLKTAEDEQKQLFKAVNNLKYINTSLDKAVSAQDRLLKEFNKIEICPFCNSKIKKV